MYFIDNQSRKAVYEQIVEQTERFVLTGILKADEPMPSVRALSMELSVNPNTIQKAYSELERRGVIYISPGKGSFVSSGATGRLAEKRLDVLDDIESYAHECCIAGIEKELALQAVENGYSKGGNT